MNRFFVSILVVFAVATAACNKKKNSPYKDYEVFGFQVLTDTAEAFHFDFVEKTYQYSIIPNYRENTIVYDASNDVVGCSDLMGNYIFSDRASMVPLRMIKMGNYLSQVAYDAQDRLLIGSYYDSLGWHLKVLDSYSAEVLTDSLSGLVSIVPAAYFYKAGSNEYFLQRGKDDALVAFDPATANVVREIPMDKRFSSLIYVPEKDWALGLAYHEADDNIYINAVDVSAGKTVRSVMLNKMKNYKNSYLSYDPVKDLVLLLDYNDEFCFIDFNSGEELESFRYMAEAEVFFLRYK